MSTFVMNVTKPMSASDIESLNQTKGIVLDSENVEVLNTLYYKKKDTKQKYQLSDKEKELLLRANT